MADQLRPADLLLVGLGGSLGTAVRIAVTPTHGPGAFPLATFLVNLIGAGLLGLLLERLARPSKPRRQHRLSLLVGTGCLGGFTTYSALAVDSVQLLRTGATALAAAYAVGTLLLGAAATWLGILAGRGRRVRP